MTVFPFIRTVDPLKISSLCSENVSFTLLLPSWMISRSTFPTNKGDWKEVENNVFWERLKHNLSIIKAFNVSPLVKARTQERQKKCTLYISKC